MEDDRPGINVGSIEAIEAGLDAFSIVTPTRTPALRVWAEVDRQRPEAAPLRLHMLAAAVRDRAL